MSESNSEDQMRAIVSDAVADGIRRAVSDPETWTAALEAMQTRATASAGSFVLGGIASAFKRLFWLVVIGTGIYVLGGWSALAGTVKALFPGAAPH